jgi:hypothetical protein
MTIQDGFGKIGFFEDFQGIGDPDGATLTSGTSVRWNDVLVIGISGDAAQTYTVDESGGVIAHSGAGAAADGVCFTSSPMQPSGNGTIVVVGRWKVSAATDYRCFFGWQETVDSDEAVNPFTLNGTTLTANNTGQTVGFYYDTQATTDGFRFMASSDGTASTTATLNQAREGSTTLGSLGILAGETLTADKWIVARVEIDPDGTARGYLGHTGMGNQSGLTLVATVDGAALDEDALYYPVMHQLEQSTGDPSHETDYFGATGNRDWTS